SGTPIVACSGSEECRYLTSRRSEGSDSGCGDDAEDRGDSMIFHLGLLDPEHIFEFLDKHKHTGL
ncbi:hypothetical protein Pmar_PMAR010202, partial [Perkinsus marinus ATCC 50983]